MGKHSRIGIGILVGLVFASGLMARARYDRGLSAQPSARQNQGDSRVASLGSDNLDLRPIETLYEVLGNLREHYVEQITPQDEGKMTYDALQAMLGALKDPNTRFFLPDQRRVVADETEGKFHGIGAMLGIKRAKSGTYTNERLIVLSALPGGAAAAAGLNPGDEIQAVDGKPVLPFNPFQKMDQLVKDSQVPKADTKKLEKLFEAEQKRIESGVPVMEAENTLMTDDKKAVELTVLPKKSTVPIKVKIQPREFSVEPVTSKLISNDRYGYIKINCFSNRTPELFAAAMKDVSGKDAKGLVLDLRGLAGGDVPTAVSIAKWFIPGRQLAVVARSRQRKAAITVPSSSEEKWNKPLVVLVDSGTARVGEVLASALKDNGAAQLVGEKTYGDFTEATLVDEADGSAYMMTTGAFLTSKGVSHGGKGLSVDVESASVPHGDDNQLKEAVRVVGTAGLGSGAKAQ